MNRSQRSWGAAGLSAAVVAVLWSAASANTGTVARRREGRQLHAARPDRHGPRALLLQREPGHRAGVLRGGRRRLDSRRRRSRQSARRVQRQERAVPDARLVAELAARQVRRHARLGRPAGAGGRAAAGRPRARRDDDRRSVRGRDQDLDDRLSRPDRRFVREEEEQEGEPHRGAQRRARRQARAGRRGGREGHAGRVPGSAEGRGVREDRLLDADRAGARRQVRRLSHAGRSRAVRDEQLRRRARASRR